MHRYRHSFIILVLTLYLGAVPQDAVMQPVQGPLPAQAHGSQLKPAFILPGLVSETSGLVYHADGLWTFNDSGGEPELYKLDPRRGKLLQTVVVTGAGNRDWEDMCQDEDYFYIGDFGNNRGNRDNLRVYRVAKPVAGGEAVVRLPAEVIAFRYADQEVHAVRDRDHDFDCESVVSFGDSLLLFSKNWVNGRTRMYWLPKEPGSYEIAPAGELDARGLVTGADYCRKNGMLALVGYTNRVPFVILVPGFDGSSLETEGAWRIDFPSLAGAQTEGICFMDESKVAVSSEDTKKFEQAVYILPPEILQENRKEERP